MEGILAAVALIAVGLYFHLTTEPQRQQHLLYAWILLAVLAAVPIVRLIVR